MEITIKDLENNLKTLPKELLGNVNDYIDFLKEKYLTKDWANQLSETQKKSIEKGILDIENENIISHEEAKQKIRNYLQSKAL
jgi:RNA polymerase-binding transcription factor DksA